MTYLRTMRACSKYMRFMNVSSTQALFFMVLSEVLGKHSAIHQKKNRRKIFSGILGFPRKKKSPLKYFDFCYRNVNATKNSFQH